MINNNLFWDELYRNKCLWVTLLSWFIAQGSKISLGSFKEKRFDFHWVLGTGGMPSAHSAASTSLAVCVGIEKGFDSSLFTLAAIFALVTMFDAQTWRRSIGYQAGILNRMMGDSAAGREIQDQRLRELVGHTPVEVFVGAIIGVVVPLFAYK
jgi:uncharacterized protein